ncbi:MAG: hypothetical protein J0M24_21410 [Verrucomicrobia bacterium]|nr:hypothetical protein [Verrucomicrobiota bacterium]
MIPALEKLIRDLRSAEVTQKRESLCTISLLWEWKILDRRDSADLLSDAALLEIEIARDELEAALNVIEEVAADGTEDISIRLSALSALGSAPRFKCVEIGVQLLNDAHAALSHDDLTEIIFYISPFAGSSQFRSQILALPSASDLIRTLGNLQQSEDSRLAQAARRLLNSLM